MYLDLKVLESTIYFNQKGSFEAKALPSEIQYSPVYAITSEDINNDGNPDLCFGGNQFLVKPQFGKYDASKGWIIFGPYSKEQNTKEVVSLNASGQIRALKWIIKANKKILVIAKNDERLSFYTY
jgi:hypothetical protein